VALKEIRKVYDETPGFVAPEVRGTLFSGYVKTIGGICFFFQSEHKHIHYRIFCCSVEVFMFFVDEEVSIISVATAPGAALWVDTN
jgi:hypothetical protein